MTHKLHERFVALHQVGEPLLLVNVWDAASAVLWQAAGAPAIATSSAAVAWSRGYADGGALPRADLLGSLRDIIRVTRVPITIDIENGYSDDPQAVAALAAEVVGAGAVGINLEDGAGSPDRLVAKIRAIRALPAASPLFINARTDVYLRGIAQGDAAVAETIARLSLYREAGADGGFVPGLADLRETAAIAAAVPLAINVMAIPALPKPVELHAAGIKRISVGPGLFKVAYGAGRAATEAFLNGDLQPLFQYSLDYEVMNRAFGN